MSGLIVAGDIITQDPARPRVEAVAIADGRVVATGTLGDVHAALPGATVRAQAGTVVPGMTDSHVHMLWWGRGLERADVSACTSVADVLRNLAAYAAAHPDDPWIAGDGGIDAEALDEGRFPTADELEAATGGRPLFLDRRSHDALVNRTALRLAGITDSTLDPPGGVIERDERGVATGFLVERPAAELVERAMPAATEAELRRWILAAQQEFLAAGVTGAVDPALTPAELAAFAALADSGELTVRVTAFPLGDGEVDPAVAMAAFTAHGIDLKRRDDRLRIGPIKLFLDGGGSLGTAMLREPWPGTDGYYGHWTTSREGMEAYSEYAAATGAGLGVHAVGGAAIDLCVETFGAAIARHPGTGPLFQIIHAYLWPTAENMSRMRELGIMLATQPPLQWGFGPSLVARFGDEAVGRAHPMRDWVEAGVTVGSGCDGPGNKVDPLWAMWQMRARTIAGRGEEAIGIDQAVSAQQALDLVTTGAATVAWAPERGRLVEGAPADLVALDVDPLAASPQACRDGGVLATIVGGEVVFEA